MNKQITKFFLTFIPIIIFIVSCRQESVGKTETVSFKYPDTIVKLGLEKEFDNVSWFYFAGMNTHGYSCTKFNAKPKYSHPYSTVENSPNLDHIEFFHDTISLTIADNYKKDTLNYCGPVGQFGVSDASNPYYINFWIKKGNTQIIFRNVGAPVNYRGISQDGLKNSLISFKDQEKQLIDTINKNLSKLSPWFLIMARRKGILK